MPTIVYSQDLFARNKNNQVILWSITVEELEDGTGAIVISHQTGYEGKAVKHIEFVKEGKNIGKSNETTPLAQAIQQADSRVNLQLDKGYKHEVPTEKTNALGYPMPMLALPLEKIRGSLGEKFFVQPKADGFRCLSLMDEDGEVILYTRRGKKIDTLPHLVDFYKEVLSPGDHVDGELYLHGEPLQKIASLVKRQQPGSEKIVHHVYDIVSEKTYEDRYKRLCRLFSSDTSGVVSIMDTNLCEDLSEAQELFVRYRAEGYEGAMIRTNDLPYQIGARSKSLIKMKGFEEEDYPIIGVKQGKPSYKNGTVLDVAILVCKTPEGHEFSVTAPGNEAQKHQSWLDRADLVGGMVEVKYSGKVAKTGIPFHPVAVKIKDRELD